MTDLAKKKLSELMREGAALRPTAKYQYFDDSIRTEHGVRLGPGHLCSDPIGAIYEAAFGLPAEPLANDWQAMKQRLFETFPELNKPLEELGMQMDDPCSAFPNTIRNNNLHGFIIHLSMSHKWSREQIADALAAAGL